jgi:hypothetical protein
MLLLSGLRSGMVRGRGGEISEAEAVRLCPVFQESLPGVWQSYWASVRPTAVVCLRDKWVYSLYGYCASRGIRIPEDVSVLCMSHSEALMWCHPRPVCMKHPSRRALANFKAWVRGGCLPLGRKRLWLEETEGESIAPCRAPTD